MKRLGPELKMPKLKGSEMKVPPFLSDLYYDLRERRLLPIIALILVAIVAAPILLGGGSSEPEPVPSTTTGAGTTASASKRSLTVVQAEPGLRNYKKRLAHRSPTDPFKQRFHGPVLDNGELNPQTETPSTTVTTSESSPGTGETAPVPSSGGSPTEPSLTFYAFAIDVRITKSEGGGRISPEQEADGLTAADDRGVTVGSPVELAADAEPTIRHEVLPLTKLPGDKRPVATYMGPSKHGLPLFLVSSKVKSVFGESKCVSGDDSCQLIEVEPKFPITFVYGANEVRYTFNVLKIEPVVTGHS